MRKIFVLAIAVVGVLVLAVPALGGGRPLTAYMSGSNEVPANESPAAGVAHVTLNQGQGEVCVDIESGGFLGTVVAGHIHHAAAGQNGGVVVNLGVNSADYSACVDGVDGDLIQEIRHNPSDYYINIHTDVIPSGEIRGQLSK